jgi:hypothetical protein
VQVVYISSMKSRRDIPSLSREELPVLVAEQQRQISKLQGQLVKAVERLTREKQRQSDHTRRLSADFASGRASTAAGSISRDCRRLAARHQASNHRTTSAAAKSQARNDSERCQ